MADQTEIRLYITGDSAGAIRAFKALEKSSESSGKKLDEHGKKADQLGKHFSSLRGTLGGLTSSFGGLGVVGGLIGGAGAVTAITSITSHTAELAQETEKFHAITGIGAQGSLDYAAALRARGFDTTQAATAFKFMAKSAMTAERQEIMYGNAQSKAAAKGKRATSLLGIQAQAYHRLGIQSAATFKTLSSEQQFQTVIRAFSRMKDGLEKTALATSVFGKGGAALMPILEGGALGLEHQYQMAKKFFPTLRGEGVHALEELKEKQAESKMAWEGLEFTLGMKLIPVMTAVMGWFTKVSQNIREGRGFWGELGNTVNKVVEVFKSVVSWFERTPSAVNTLKTAVVLLAGAWGVEKAQAFVGAILKLTKLSAIASGLNAVAKGVAGVELAATGPELAAFVAALVGLLYAFEKISGTPVFKTLAEDAGLLPRSHPKKYVYSGPAGTQQGKSAAEAEQLYYEGYGRGEVGRIARNYRPGERMPAGLAAAEHHIQAQHAQDQKIITHAHLYIDGKEIATSVAEQALRNPHVSRILSEGVAHYGLKRAARE